MIRVRRRGGTWSALALLLAAATGCTASDLPARGCTEIGSAAGVAVVVEHGPAAHSPTLTLRICQTDCIERPVHLEPGSVPVGQSCASDDPDGSCSASSSPDGTLVGFVAVPTLTAGDVRVDGELRTGSRVRQLTETRLTAEPTYPNGPDCPAGAVQGTVRVTAGGLR